jgi:beta-ribofuranosylaminobenzene 5'-phosphate synthase
MQVAQIKTPARIHMSLLDMSDSGYRINGGIGFFISGLSLSVEIKFSKSIELIDNRILKVPLNFPKAVLLSWLEGHLIENNIKDKFSITLFGNTPSHYGFGVSTSVRMACVEGIYQLLDKKVPHNIMIKQSHRGGTSGIGVHGYFTGGCIFDLGRESTKNHTPSRCGESAEHLPLLLQQLPMPDWQIGVLIPNNIKPINHQREVNFFNQTCPIDQQSVYETSYHALFGVLASVKTKNFSSFCRAVNVLQTQTWKQEERSLYPKISVFEKILLDAGAKAIGMSSLGPSLYFFADNIKAVLDKAKNLTLDAEILHVNINNIGREITND